LIAGLQGCTWGRPELLILLLLLLLLVLLVLLRVLLLHMSI
jgi:hypothetical protein